MNFDVWLTGLLVIQLVGGLLSHFLQCQIAPLHFHKIAYDTDDNKSKYYAR